MFRTICSHRATASVFINRRNASSMNLLSPCVLPILTSFNYTPPLNFTSFSFPFIFTHIISFCSRLHFTSINKFQLGCTENQVSASVVRFISSNASDKHGKTTDKTKKDITNVEEDPFSAPTYNILEKPVTFVEGASYSVVILAGLGIAAAAGYAVFKELIFQPKEYKIYNKALKRIQDDGQVRARIGFPITGYGQESRNRAAGQRIPNRVWTDEDGVEHVEVNFYIRGPHGHGKVFSEMFKGPADNEWKFTYLIVEIRAPSSAQLILESYVPDYSPNK